MRNWHPYRLEWREKNTTFYGTVQFADPDASSHIKCTVLQQEGVWVGEKKQARKVHKKVLTESHQFLPSTSKPASSVLVTTEPIFFSGQNGAYVTPWAWSLTKPLVQCPSPCSELMLQRPGNRCFSELLSMEENPQKILTEVKNSAAWTMVTGYPLL